MKLRMPVRELRERATYMAEEVLFQILNGTDLDPETAPESDTTQLEETIYSILLWAAEEVADESNQAGLPRQVYDSDGDPMVWMDWP